MTVSRALPIMTPRRLPVAAGLLLLGPPSLGRGSVAL